MTESEESARVVKGYAHFDGMTWPLPDPELDWRLRYGKPSRDDFMKAAFIISAYASLIWCPDHKRRRVIRELRSQSVPPTPASPPATNPRERPPMSTEEIHWLRLSLGASLLAHLHPGGRLNVIAIGATGLIWIGYAIYMRHIRRKANAR